MSSNRIVFPLDVSSEREAWEWCSKLRGHVGVMKVGLELFTKFGPRILAAPKENGFKVFLDLKLHDIPNTVAQATKAAVSHGVEYLSVHTAGGPAMLSAAVEAARGRTILLGITVLTSIDAPTAKNVFGPGREIECVAWDLVEESAKVGVDHFVCSPAEVSTLKDFSLVVPGIRPANGATQDQQRVGTAAQAIKDGADMLVIGRPIREAPDPVLAAVEFATEISVAQRERDDNVRRLLSAQP